MRTRIVCAVLTCWMAMAVIPARAQEPPPIDPVTGNVRSITFGDPAPRVAPATWVRAGPINRLEPGRVYVVWFFASWSEKSHKALSTLASIHERFKDQGVTVLGVGVWEPSKPLPDNTGYEGRFREFVTERAASLPYPICYDGDQGEMAQTWMRGADRKSIPTAFVIDRKGRVAWMGHPLSVDEPIATIVEQVLAGTFDVKAAAERDRVQREQLEKARKTENRLRKALEANDGKAAVTLLNDLLAIRPAEFTPRIREVFEVLAVDNADEAGAYAWLKTLEAGPLKDDAPTLNNVAWDIATAEGLKARDLDLAHRLAARAVDVSGGREAYILDTLARVQFDLGRIEEAIATQEKAVALAEPGRQGDYQATLDRYKAAKGK
ncbi:MAG: hypothetical protein HBSAPP03_21590 [Phycisphaerae bacterium]|nr:MAG: hypothetical protein HBSAPP03_21590 [Phycisphaerae bacterium]